MMDAFLPIHLPWFITLHAVGFTALGLYFLFSAPPPGKPSGHTPQLGVATVAIGLAYLFTAYMPVEENQWLHASVPVRMVLRGPSDRSSAGWAWIDIGGQEEPVESGAVRWLGSGGVGLVAR